MLHAVGATSSYSCHASFFVFSSIGLDEAASLELDELKWRTLGATIHHGKGVPSSVEPSI